MEKFSNIRMEKKVKESDVLFKNKYMEVIDFEEWTIVKESDCVIAIPYLIETNEIIIRYEYIPTFKYNGDGEYHVTLISGTIDKGETPYQTLIREMEEETGLIINHDYKNAEEMQPLYLCKGNTSKIYPYILPLNQGDYKESVAYGDGSISEKLSRSLKLDVRKIDSLTVGDIQTVYLLQALKKYLNIL